MKKELRTVTENGKNSGNTKGRTGSAAWFDQHFPWTRFFSEQVKGHSTIRPARLWDYLGYTGTMALALVILQFGSGLFMLFYYVPQPEKAFGSLQMIRNDVPFGLLYSNLHAICSRLLILTLLVHMFRIMIISAHRGPREKQWYLGALLLLLMLLAGFSGYLLPWSQQSYWASVIGTEAVRAIPLIGDTALRLLRGGENITGATLHRFFALHVTIIPISIIVLIYMHVKKVWSTGVIAAPDTWARVSDDECISCGKCEPACSFDALFMIEKQGRKLPLIDRHLCNACRACANVCPEECIGFESDRGTLPTEPIFPHNLLHRLEGVMALLIILFFSVFFLYGILMREKVPANPLLTPAEIRPEWYFLAAYQVLRKLPSKGLGLITLLAVALLVFFLPALDRSGPRDPRRRPVYLLLVLAGIIAFIVLTVMGYS